jgi:hypothetical protein
MSVICGFEAGGEGGSGYNRCAVGVVWFGGPKVVFGAALFPKTTVGLWLEHLRCSGLLIIQFPRMTRGSRTWRSGMSGLDVVPCF